MRRIEDARENGMHRLTGGHGSGSSPEPEFSPISTDALLETVREMRRKGFREPSSRGIARYLDSDVDPSLVGRMMSSLATQGYVDQIGEQSPYRWNIQSRPESP